jgi:hypothetical protein
METKLTIFEDQHIRRVWDEIREEWYFSIIDIIRILIEQPDQLKARKYWNKLKERLNKEGSELVTNCHQLKMVAEDKKMRLTDVANMPNIFRLIQSIPSPKAEPIKLWLAKVGHERIQEIADPERSVNRGRTNWQKLGHSEKWIQQRMMGQEIRNKLTDYWQSHEITKEQEYAILTNIIHSEWADLTVKQHKDLKGLKTQNLRDHMSDAELVFTALAELSTRQIAETDMATGMGENAVAAKQGGHIAKDARVALESKTGKKVISSTNYLKENKKLKIK